MLLLPLRLSEPELLFKSYQPPGHRSRDRATICPKKQLRSDQGKRIWPSIYAKSRFRIPLYSVQTVPRLNPIFLCHLGLESHLVPPTITFSKRMRTERMKLGGDVEELKEDRISTIGENLLFMDASRA